MKRRESKEQVIRTTGQYGQKLPSISWQWRGDGGEMGHVQYMCATLYISATKALYVPHIYTA
jgi:hypothetical protein